MAAPEVCMNAMTVTEKETTIVAMQAKDASSMKNEGGKILFSGPKSVEFANALLKADGQPGVGEAAKPAAGGAPAPAPKPAGHT